MGGLPDLIFVLDTVKEQIAIQEATKLNIPIAAIIDSNSNPDGVTYPIPGNDDSTKSISLFCDLISKAALDGIAQSQNETSTDSETAPKVTKNKNVKAKDTKSDGDKAEDKEIKTKKSDKTGDSALKKSEEKEDDESKNPLSDETSVADSDSIEEKVSEISEKEEK
jgi:small subunit ribosomal protein S2